MTYTIASGDTFHNLALKFNCPLDDIIGINPSVDPTKLQLGQVIRLPVSGKHNCLLHYYVWFSFWSFSLALHSQSTTDSDEEEYSDVMCHIVFAGDTLERIAEWYHCTIEDLINLNPDIQPSLIYPGQKLRLPLNDRTRQNPRNERQ